MPWLKQHRQERPDCCPADAPSPERGVTSRPGFDPALVTPQTLAALRRCARESAGDKEGAAGEGIDGNTTEK